MSLTSSVISFHPVFVHMLEFYHNIFDLFSHHILREKNWNTFTLPCWSQHIWEKKTQAEKKSVDEVEETGLQYLHHS